MIVLGLVLLGLLVCGIKVGPGLVSLVTTPYIAGNWTEQTDGGCCNYITLNQSGTSLTGKLTTGGFIVGVYDLSGSINGTTVTLTLTYGTLTYQGGTYVGATCEDVRTLTLSSDHQSMSGNGEGHPKSGDDSSCYGSFTVMWQRH